MNTDEMRKITKPHDGLNPLAIGATVRRENVTAHGVVTALELSDGTKLVGEMEVYKPKSIIDRLMDGESVALELTYNSSGKVRRRTRQCHLWHDAVQIEDTGKTKCLFCDILTASHNDKAVDLAELRRRVAEREIERLKPFAYPEPAKPDMSKEWWIVAKHGLPELEDSRSYVYVHLDGSGREHSNMFRNPCSEFEEGRGLLWNSDGNLVTKIKEAN